jgi:hypothetical protein
MKDQAIILTLMIIVAGPIFYFVALPNMVFHDYYVVGQVSNVEYSAGGFGHSDLTTIYFADNRTLVISAVVQNITIGKVYNFTMSTSNWSYSPSFLGVLEVSP